MSLCPVEGRVARARVVDRRGSAAATAVDDYDVRGAGVANPLFEIAEKESFGAAHADTPRTIIGTARTANSFDLLIFFMLFSPYLSDT
jgi:hypothetical protein